MNVVKNLPKTTPITNDYMITGNVLGLGINGKVVECVAKSTQEKYALKVGKPTNGLVNVIIINANDVFRCCMIP